MNEIYVEMSKVFKFILWHILSRLNFIVQVFVKKEEILIGKYSN
jgi:hypothetical protein